MTDFKIANVKKWYEKGYWYIFSSKQGPIKAVEVYVEIANTSAAAGIIQIESAVNISIIILFNLRHLFQL